MYYTVLLCTTHRYFALHNTTLYYTVLFCSTQYYSVLRSTILYYTQLLGTTQYYFVLSTIILYYILLLCSTQYYLARRNTTLYHCISQYHFVFHSITLYYILRVRKEGIRDTRPLKSMWFVIEGLIRKCRFSGPKGDGPGIGVPEILINLFFSLKLLYYLFTFPVGGGPPPI